MAAKVVPLAPNQLPAIAEDAPEVGVPKILMALSKHLQAGNLRDAGTNLQHHLEQLFPQHFDEEIPGATAQTQYEPQDNSVDLGLMRDAVASMQEALRQKDEQIEKLLSGLGNGTPTPGLDAKSIADLVAQSVAAEMAKLQPKPQDPPKQDPPVL